MFFEFDHLTGILLTKIRQGFLRVESLAYFCREILDIYREDQRVSKFFKKVKKVFLTFPHIYLILKTFRNTIFH